MNAYNTVTFRTIVCLSTAVPRAYVCFDENNAVARLVQTIVFFYRVRPPYNPTVSNSRRVRVHTIDNSTSFFSLHPATHTTTTSDFFFLREHGKQP